MPRSGRAKKTQVANEAKAQMKTLNDKDQVKDIVMKSNNNNNNNNNNNKKKNSGNVKKEQKQVMQKKLILMAGDQEYVMVVSKVDDDEIIEEETQNVKQHATTTTTTSTTSFGKKKKSKKQNQNQKQKEIAKIASDMEVKKAMENDKEEIEKFIKGMFDGICDKFEGELEEEQKLKTNKPLYDLRPILSDLPIDEERTQGEEELPMKLNFLPKSLQDLILWRDTLITGAHIFLGVLLLSTLNSNTLIKLISRIGLFIMMHGFFYGTLRHQIRFRPYEKLIQFNVVGSPKWLNTLVRILIKCFNSLVSVAVRMVLHNHNILAVICLWLCLMEIRNFGKSVDGLTTFTYIYLGIFLVPRIVIDAKVRLKRAWWEAQLPGIYHNKDSVMRLIVRFIKLFQLVEGPAEAMVTYVSRGQQTDEEFTDERIKAIIMALDQHQQELELQQQPTWEHNSCEIYTLWHILGVLTTLRLPQRIQNLIYWQNAQISGMYLMLGLNMMTTNHSLLQIVALVTLIEFIFLYVYLTVRHVIQFLPYEILIRVKIDMPPEQFMRMTRMAVNWINRWIYTMQYILFSGDLFAALGVWMWLVEMRKLGHTIDGQTLLIYVYISIFLLPHLASKLKHAANVWRRTQLPGCSFYMRYLVMFIDLFEYVPTAQANATNSYSTGIYVDRGQQTNSDDPDHLELLEMLRSFDPIATSVRKRGNCGRNASLCLLSEVSCDEKGSLSA